MPDITGIAENVSVIGPSVDLEFPEKGAEPKRVDSAELLEGDAVQPVKVDSAELIESDAVQPVRVDSAELLKGDAVQSINENVQHIEDALISDVVTADILPASEPETTNGHMEPFSSPAWSTLKHLLPSRNPDFDHWWSLTGEHLATLIQAAGYDDAKSFESLLFLYHWIVPNLGPRPNLKQTHKWRSILGIEGSPIEYSWKWNTSTKPPDVRITLEAINQYSGTDMDPLNQHASVELLHKAADSFPQVDLTWSKHLLGALYRGHTAKYAGEAAAGKHFHTTIMSAFEFVPGGIGFKTYFIPQQPDQAAGPIPLAQWEEYIAPMMAHGDEALKPVVNYLSNTEEGRKLHAIMVAVDNVVPEDSRLKIYFHTESTSFRSVRETMTLGGALQPSEQALEDLKTFIYAIGGLPDDFPEDKEIPLYSELNPSDTGSKDDEPAVLMSGYQYYIDVAPRLAQPEVKFFTPARRYGPNDLHMAQNVCKWMADHGRGQYCDQFLDSLKRIAGHRRLDKGKGIQTFTAALIKPNGELDVTSYLGSEAWHPERLLNEASAI